MLSHKNILQNSKLWNPITDSRVLKSQITIYWIIVIAEGNKNDIVTMTDHSYMGIFCHLDLCPNDPVKQQASEYIYP